MNLGSRVEANWKGGARTYPFRSIHLGKRVREVTRATPRDFETCRAHVEGRPGRARAGPTLLRWRPRVSRLEGASTQRAMPARPGCARARRTEDDRRSTLRGPRRQAWRTGRRTAKSRAAQLAAPSRLVWWPPPRRLEVRRAGTRRFVFEPSIGHDRRRGARDRLERHGRVRGNEGLTPTPSHLFRTIFRPTAPHRGR